MRASRGDVLVRAGILLAFLAVVAVAVVVGDHGSGGTAATAGEPASEPPPDYTGGAAFVSALFGKAGDWRLVDRALRSRPPASTE